VAARIDEKRVRYVARLAKLALSDDEVAHMVHDLDAILGYVELLGQVDTTDVEPTTQPLDLETPLREDRPQEPLALEDVVRAAPAHEAGAFLVPKVIE